jgi:hypothetical protein
MKRIAWIALAAALLMGGTVFAMAQNGPATGGYPPARWNPNLYGYYGYYAPPGMRLERPTMFWAIRSRTTATGLGAVGGGSQS